MYFQSYLRIGKINKYDKKVSTKLDEKLKSGEIKKSELMKEANEIMSKLSWNERNGKMFSKMGGLGGKNTNRISLNL